MPISRADVLKESLENFYKKKGVFDIFFKVVNDKTIGYSLRVIEWFCNNYSKKFDIIYKNGRTKEFNVYLSYKSQLDSYSKKQFDPFNRKHAGFPSFEFSMDGKKMTTTVGQMNFFKWCISNGVLGYIQNNLDSIKKDMGKITKELSKTSSNSKEKTSKDKSVKKIKRKLLTDNKIKIRRDQPKVLVF